MATERLQEAFDTQLELETLLDKYPEEFQEVSESEWHVVLAERPGLSLTLKFLIPIEYPEEPPRISVIHATKGIKPSPLLALLRQEGKELVGSPMVGDLVEVAKDWFKDEADRIENQPVQEVHDQPKQEESVRTDDRAKVTANGLMMFHHGVAMPLDESAETSRANALSVEIDERPRVAEGTLPLECWITILSFLPNLRNIFTVGQACLGWNVELAILTLMSNPNESTVTEFRRRQFPKALRRSAHMYNQVLDAFFLRRKMVDSALLFTNLGAPKIGSTTLVGALASDRLGNRRSRLFRYLPSVRVGTLRVISQMNDVFHWLEREFSLGIWEWEVSGDGDADCEGIRVKQRIRLPSVLRDLAVDPQGQIVTCACDDGKVLILGPDLDLKHTIELDEKGNSDKVVSCLSSSSGMFAFHPRKIHSVDLANGKLVDRYILPGEATVDHLHYLPQSDGNCFIVGLNDGSLKLADRREEAGLWRTLGNCSSPKLSVLGYNAVAFLGTSPTNAVSAIQVVNPWNPTKTYLGMDSKHVLSVTSMDWMVMAGHEQGATLWDVRKPIKVLSTLNTQSVPGDFVALDSRKCTVIGTSFLQGTSAEFFDHSGSLSSTALLPISTPVAFEYGWDEFSFATSDGTDVQIHSLERPLDGADNETVQPAQPHQLQVRAKEHRRNMVREQAKRAREQAKMQRRYRKLPKPKIFDLGDYSGRTSVVG